ncbi:amidohydrolase family protein [Amycolatopsis jejuensis]|uniref:amidohydrolase family protein n=1 Tax=Amycolatopsis jejuensis TaxID=330084 RepID=UPI0005245E71|nr:amidohydrolase family protein [Amycolatopsis jejuensis]
MGSRLAVRAERVFDGERFLPEGTVVLVDDGRITSVGPATGPASGPTASGPTASGPTTQKTPQKTPQETPQADQVLDFPGGTLLPGLIDAHVHLCCDSKEGALDRLADHDPTQQAQVIEAGLRRQLAAGVTAVRDLGDRNFATQDWRNREGLPKVATAGPPITIPGGHCWNMGGAVSGVKQIRDAIAERVDRGVDVVKIMGSGGINTQGTDVYSCQFSDPDLRLIVDLAHAANLPVTVHAHALAAVEQAVDAGADGIEHCTCLTPDGVRLSDRLIHKLSSRNIAVCPTIGVMPGMVPPEKIRRLLARYGLSVEARAKDAATMFAKGVRTVSGGDSGINQGKPHGVLPWSVAGLVTAGVPLVEALASATSVAADGCGFATKGRIRPGFDADLVVVDGDLPAALGRPATVIINGNIAAR